MTHLSTPDLIRALGGADAICKPGCSCRGSYTGPERRKEHREPFHSCPACQPCPAEGCELFGPHDLHRDSEGFQWKQKVTA